MTRKMMNVSGFSIKLEIKLQGENNKRIKGYGPVDTNGVDLGIVVSSGKYAR